MFTDLFLASTLFCVGAIVFTAEPRERYSALRGWNN
jgi:hypothetical protein